LSLLLLSLSLELFFIIVRFLPPPPLDDDDLRPPDDDVDGTDTVLCGVVEVAITPSRNRGGGVRDRLDDSRGVAVAALAAAEAAAASTADNDGRGGLPLAISMGSKKAKDDLCSRQVREQCVEAETRE
jgi:hypothetical protein